MKQRDEYIVECKGHNPRPVNLICDATFYGKRKDEVPLEGISLVHLCLKIMNPKRYSCGNISKVKLSKTIDI
jgi:hypothetical protein